MLKLAKFQSPGVHCNKKFYCSYTPTFLPLQLESILNHKRMLLFASCTLPHKSVYVYLCIYACMCVWMWCCICLISYPKRCFPLPSYIVILVISTYTAAVSMSECRRLLHSGACGICHQIFVWAPAFCENISTFLIMLQLF